MDERPIVCGNAMQGFENSPFNGKYTAVIDASPPERKIARNDSYSKYSDFETSATSSRTDDSIASSNSNASSACRFETFVMTGDMIIRTSTPQKKNVSPKSSPSETQKDITGSPQKVNTQKDSDKNIPESKKQESGRKSRIPKPSTKAKPKVTKKSQIPTFKEASPIIQHPVLSLPRSGLLVSSEESRIPTASALDSVLSRAMPAPVNENVIEPLETVESRARPAPVESSPRNSPQVTRKSHDSPGMMNGPPVSNIPEFTQDNIPEFTQDGGESFPPPPPPPPLEYQDNYSNVIEIEREPQIPSSVALSSLPGLHPCDETNNTEAQEYLPPPPPLELENNYAADTNFEDLPPPPDDLLQDEELLPAPENSAIYDQFTSPMHVNISNSYSPHDCEVDSQTNAAQSLPGFSSQNGEISSVEHKFPNYSEDDNSINHETPEKQAARSIVVSKSAEKISKMTGKSQAIGVRTSKSHENCLEGSLDGMTLVNIDFEDNIASSVDALHYQQSQTSLDRERERQQEFQSKSANCSPERRDKHSDKVFMPAFISLEEPRSLSKPVKKGAKSKDSSRRSMERSPEKEILPGPPVVAPKPEQGKPQPGASSSHMASTHVSHVIEGVTVGESSVNSCDSPQHVPVLRQSPKHYESDINNSTNNVLLHHSDPCTSISSNALTDAAGASSAESAPALAPAATDIIVGAAAACAVDKSPSQESEKGSRDSKENEKSQRLKAESSEEPPMQHIEPLVQIKSVMSRSDSSETEGRYPSESMELRYNHAEVLAQTSTVHHSTTGHSQSHKSHTPVEPGYMKHTAHYPQSTGFYDSSSSTNNHSSSDTESASELSPSGPSSPESEAEFDSVFHQPTKDVDRPSAQRLAKRLYHMQGFKKGDVSKHLSKKLVTGYLL